MNLLKVLYDEQVVIVPFVDGMLGARIPPFIWFGAIVSLIGVALLECGGTPPCVWVHVFFQI